MLTNINNKALKEIIKEGEEREENLKIFLKLRENLNSQVLTLLSKEYSEKELPILNTLDENYDGLVEENTVTEIKEILSQCLGKDSRFAQYNAPEIGLLLEQWELLYIISK
ncbi:MAG: hypothetical protein KAS01_00430 [Candidatus Pacebacteria bacterium]|nr:hypothetical protein [Candidatus Paceibacterota bacterium]